MLNFELSKINSDWDSWKKYLGQAVEFAGELGISTDKINSLAEQAGNLLADNIPPANPEQKALKELWQVADSEEKKMLARLITKLVTTS